MEVDFEMKNGEWENSFSFRDMDGIQNAADLKNHRFSMRIVVNHFRCSEQYCHAHCRVLGKLRQRRTLQSTERINRSGHISNKMGEWLTVTSIPHSPFSINDIS